MKSWDEAVANRAAQMKARRGTQYGQVFYNAYVRDPDGNKLVFKVFLKAAGRKDLNGAIIGTKQNT